MVWALFSERNSAGAGRHWTSRQRKELELLELHLRAMLVGQVVPHQLPEVEVQSERGTAGSELYIYTHMYIEYNIHIACIYIYTYIYIHIRIHINIKLHMF